MGATFLNFKNYISEYLILRRNLPTLYGLFKLCQKKERGDIMNTLNKHI